MLMDGLDLALVAGVVLCAGMALGWMLRDLLAPSVTRQEIDVLNASLQAAIGRRECKATAIHLAPLMGRLDALTDDVRAGNVRAAMREDLAAAPKRPARKARR